jgi:hypothetical protein
VSAEAGQGKAGHGCPAQRADPSSRYARATAWLREGGAGMGGALENSHIRHDMYSDEHSGCIVTCEGRVRRRGSAASASPRVWSTRLGDLHRELARRGDDDGLHAGEAPLLWPFLAGAALLKDGEKRHQEGEGLARSCDGCIMIERFLAGGSINAKC